MLASASAALSQPVAPATAPSTTASLATLTPELEHRVVAEPAVLTDGGEVEAPAPSLEQLVAQVSNQPGKLGPEITCMAKVVYHEAANQPLEGQLAIAQLILNRVHSGEFADSVCAVVNQRGQFFSTRRYAAPVGSQRWRTAVAIARIATEYDLPQEAPGALFYHASYVRPAWKHKHVRVARIAGHVFYR